MVGGILIDDIGLESHPYINASNLSDVKMATGPAASLFSTFWPYMMTSMQYVGYTVCALALMLAFLVSVVFSIQHARTAKMPKDIPWVGLNSKSWFPVLMAPFGEPKARRTRLQEGYDEYSQHGQPFLYPGLHWNEVVLPPSQARWIAAQPEDVVSTDAAQDGIMGLNYLTHGPNSASIHDFTVIRRDLTRNLANVAALALDEIDYSCTEVFSGIDAEEYKEYPLVHHMAEISHAIINRIVVGKPLCRDTSYHKAVERWFLGVAIAGMIHRYLIPKPFQPILSPILGRLLFPVKWRALRKMVPLVKCRMQLLRLYKKDPPGPKSGRMNDLLQWIIESQTHKADPREMHPWNIAGKAMLLQMFGSHTTVLTATKTMLSILSYPEAHQLLIELREEADAALTQLAIDPRGAVRAMPKLDSVIRETLRTRPIFAHGLQKEVVRPGGLTTPEGVYLPQGTHVSTFQEDLFHTKPGNEFRPLRYYEQTNPTVTISGRKPTQQMAVEISDTFLAFGLGRHACPGRFFAVQTLKLMLAYLITHYDFEPLEKEPEYLWLGEMDIPKEKQKVKMRLRNERSKQSRSD